MNTYNGVHEPRFNFDKVNDLGNGRTILPYGGSSDDIEIDCNWAALISHHNRQNEENKTIMIDKTTGNPILFINPLDGEAYPIPCSAATRARFMFVKRDNNGLMYFDDNGFPDLYYACEDNVIRKFEWKGIDAEIRSNEFTELTVSTRNALIDSGLDYMGLVEHEYGNLYEMVAQGIDEVYGEDSFPHQRRLAWTERRRTAGLTDMLNPQKGDSRFYQYGGVPDMISNEEHERNLRGNNGFNKKANPFANSTFGDTSGKTDTNCLESHPDAGFTDEYGLVTNKHVDLCQAVAYCDKTSNPDMHTFVDKAGECYYLKDRLAKLNPESEKTESSPVPEKKANGIDFGASSTAADYQFGDKVVVPDNKILPSMQSPQLLEWKREVDENYKQYETHDPDNVMSTKYVWIRDAEKRFSKQTGVSIEQLRANVAINEAYLAEKAKQDEIEEEEFVSEMNAYREHVASEKESNKPEEWDDLLSPEELHDRDFDSEEQEFLSSKSNNGASGDVHDILDDEGEMNLGLDELMDEDKLTPLTVEQAKVRVQQMPLTDNYGRPLGHQVQRYINASKYHVGTTDSMYHLHGDHEGDMENYADFQNEAPTQEQLDWDRMIESQMDTFSGKDVKVNSNSQDTPLGSTGFGMSGLNCKVMDISSFEGDHEFTTVVPNVVLGPEDTVVWIAINEDEIIPAWHRHDAYTLPSVSGQLKGFVSYNKHDRTALITARNNMVCEILVSNTELYGPNDYVLLRDGDGFKQDILNQDLSHIELEEEPEEMIITREVTEGNLQEIATGVISNGKHNAVSSITKAKINLTLPGKIQKDLVSYIEEAREEEGDVGIQIMAFLIKKLNSQGELYSASKLDKIVVNYMNNYALVKADIGNTLDDFAIGDEDWAELKEILIADNEQGKIDQVVDLFNRDFKDVIVAIRSNMSEINITDAIKHGMDGEDVELLTNSKGKIETHTFTLSLALPVLDLSNGNVDLTAGEVNRSDKETFQVLEDAFHYLDKSNAYASCNSILITTVRGKVVRVFRDRVEMMNLYSVIDFEL